ncbi:hypothetical protein AJ85_03420 [Alkalihalobacillus alcalophilus ATCC 27647 = CGMCC 1.3604]|uniref:Uncharacterized protein n=1 Tax=Alkalihalobacillus alcalophilus ATCC 27647 = CGMCC 1.3604 TaxID=1218173 RepID=A0A4S4JTJ2_ALKAL|nr:hypothetical protein AJ85_03420 [Alkalihalobacillus alcalophilus ATCC 27647 = CGMCC 1.3604]
MVDDLNSNESGISECEERGQKKGNEAEAIESEGAKGIGGWL